VRCVWYRQRQQQQKGAGVKVVSKDTMLHYARQLYRRQHHQGYTGEHMGRQYAMQHNTLLQCSLQDTEDQLEAVANSRKNLLCQVCRPPCAAADS
jgi:hypothetical protein